MTEDDWPLLLRWNNDPDVLYFAEGEDIRSRTMTDVQEMYRHISQHAFCFIIEHDGQPIGECWLQEMNLERIRGACPDQDCRRIDLIIGEKAFWDQGIGTEVIRLLCGFAFTQERTDCVWGCDIADYNPRSLRAFQRNGFQIVNELPQPPGAKAQLCYDLRLTAEEAGTPHE
jgi:RimJ/RimL family protein N-acetyltransferase